MESTDANPNQLSRREAEVVDEVALGLSNKQIAARLFVCEKTIKFHLTNVYKKRRVQNRQQLIVQVMTARLSAATPAQESRMMTVATDGLPTGSANEDCPRRTDPRSANG